MLEVGNGGMTTEEYRTHFSMWCLFSAPLMAGNDLQHMSSDTHDILTNKEVIAIDQDPLGVQGNRVRKDGDIEVWSKQLADGSRAVVLLNRSDGAKDMTVNWTDIGYPASFKAKCMISGRTRMSAASRGVTRRRSRATGWRS